MSRSNIFLRVAVSASIVFVLTVAVMQSSQAQTYKVIHNFSGNKDGATPVGRLAIDAAGNLYGATQYGGIANSGNGYGSVFKLSFKGTTWVVAPLYDFAGGNDGAHPGGGVSIGPDGSVYGTTAAGGGNGCQSGGSVGCGTVFRLRPGPARPVSVLAPWTETVLYRFTGGSDGASPYNDLVFDQAGSIYSTTPWGGNPGCFGLGCGVVFKLTPSNGGWTLNVLYSFSDHSSGGCCPDGGITFDSAGNLYGTAQGEGAYNGGTAFHLTPSGQGWTENVLFQFEQSGNTGFGPSGQLVFDQSGNVYGTCQGQLGGGGNVFELTPSQGGWTENILYAFTGGSDGGSPSFGVAADGVGDLYGTAQLGGAAGYGVVFKLSRTGSGWVYSVVHSFLGDSDGSYPYGNVVIGANGKIYGTAQTGGTYGYGVVWEITP